MKKILILSAVAMAYMAGFLALPKSAEAASAYFSFSTQNIYQGDVFVAELKISSLSEKINAADAVLYFDKNLIQVQGVSTGDSIFSLWPRTPVFSNQSGQIIFTGGTPQSFQGSEGSVLKIVFMAKNAGTGLLRFSDDSALYLADGKGTKLVPEYEEASVSVQRRSAEQAPEDAWGKILAQDKNPPEGLKIAIGKDPDMFGGQYFISFFATDKGSGIERYEVKEGQGEFIKTESPYVLKDQSLHSLVTVKVVDKANNETLQQVNPAKLVQKGLGRSLPIWAWALILVIILAVVWFWRGKKQKK